MFGRAGLRSAPFRQGLLPSKPRSGAEPGGARNRANPLTSEIDPAELDQSHRILFGHDLTRKPGFHFSGSCLQPDFDFSMAVVNGTSMMPWPSSALIQTLIRSIEIGNAEAMPIAVPRSFARVSSLARVRSISIDVGTASIERSALAKGIAWPSASVGAALRGADPSSR